MLPPDTKGSHHVPCRQTGQRHFPWFSLESAWRSERSYTSVAELVYSEPLRIPGKLLNPTADPVDPAHLITELHQHMACLRPVLATRHACPSTFGHSDLNKSTHIFLCQDTMCHALEPPPKRPLPCPVTVIEDTVTPQCVNQQGQAGLHPQWDWLRGENIQSVSRCNRGPSIACHGATALHTNYMLPSPHPFPRTLQHLSNHLNGGVLWEPPTVKRTLPNQRSPWHHQRKLVCTLPSDKSIKMRASDTLVSVTSVTTMLAPREHCNSEPTNSSAAADSASAHQGSQPRQELCLVFRGLASTELPCKEDHQVASLSLAQASPLLQELCPVSRHFTITGLLQGRTPSLVQASPLWWEFSLVFIRHAVLPWSSVIFILTAVNNCYSFTWLSHRASTSHIGSVWIKAQNYIQVSKRNANLYQQVNEKLRIQSE
jgi:hypothetical protein